MMIALVTGGAGFLGSHLCDKLIDKGYEVICVDNLLTGDDKNIAHLKSNPKFSFLRLDAWRVIEKKDLKADYVYHLASPASPNFKSDKSYHALPFETMQVNSMGTWTLAQFALQNKAKFLFASTSEVYGDPLEHPQKETYRGNVSTTGPRSVYDEAKRFGETITSAFIRSKKLDGRIIRIFNTYGPRMAVNDGRVVMEFLIDAMRNKPLPIFGQGLQTRSFCYVTDLIDGTIKAMEGEGTKGEVFNLGNPNEFKILELAQKIKQITGSDSKIVFERALPEDDPLRRCPDITKAKLVLNWEPKIEFEEGVQKLITYLKENS